MSELKPTSIVGAAFTPRDKTHFARGRRFVVFEEIEYQFRQAKEAAVRVRREDSGAETLHSLENFKRDFEPIQ